MRTRLSGLLRVDRLYDLDRLDLMVETPLQRYAAEPRSRSELKALSQLERARQAGLFGEHLLGHAIWAVSPTAFILLERTPSGNVVRVQADSTERPFDVNDQAKLDLGSTAKLRTLVTYLEIVAELHERFGRLDREALRWVQISPHDALSRWALDYLARASDRSLAAMLDAAMERRYSASPGEAFFTGGGVHHFENFHHVDNNRIVTHPRRVRRIDQPSLHSSDARYRAASDVRIRRGRLGGKRGAGTARRIPGALRRP